MSMPSLEHTTRPPLIVELPRIATMSMPSLEHTTKPPLVIELPRIAT
eukprot:CAMPEP_0117522598 /NCGR_PEP_ID=MMETSP0784-20121206/34290_1 /TAXON_ID=39447 /ORGANISM="" /LENGTH=46 /DNA_ID= /DNA_START= /DNA_END= /DNA_ORIENTATION=